MNQTITTVVDVGKAEAKWERQAHTIFKLNTRMNDGVAVKGHKEMITNFGRKKQFEEEKQKRREERHTLT